jgi:DNA replication and repair protein RecF
MHSFAAEPGAARNIAVSRIALSEFRCFAQLTITLDQRPVVLSGPNGSGKTNLLEAVSLLTPGSGLRGARLAEFARREAAPAAGWAVAARVGSADGPVDIGTGCAGGETRRTVRINARPAGGQSTLAAHVSALWITPAMDRMFADGAAPRRRFLDRLVYGFDAGHAGRISAYEKALRERARLLRTGRMDDAWLSALETAMAENGVAVAAARREVVARLAETLRHGIGPFPGARIAIDGAVETWLDEMPALDAEARLAGALADSRARDAETGGAAHGPHRSDLAAVHIAKDMPAAQCSTGEQKALLIAIVLGAVRLRAVRLGATPLLLMDEIAAHLDARHREALFDVVAASGAQAWLTGTDRATFASLGDRAQFLSVHDGRVTADQTVHALHR